MGSVASPSHLKLMMVIHIFHTSRVLLEFTFYRIQILDTQSDDIYPQSFECSDFQRLNNACCHCWYVIYSRMLSVIQFSHGRLINSMLL